MLIDRRHLARCVRHKSMQTARIAADDSTPPEFVIEAPDDWFCQLKAGCPTVGRETGFLYLTRKGYLANKELLYAEFAPYGSSAELDEVAEVHFRNVEQRLARAIFDYERKIRELQTFVV